MDVARQLRVLGFCHSIEQLHDVIEDEVERTGGEVLRAEQLMKRWGTECGESGCWL